MEKKCFIIMPTSDPDGYAQGHFNRVYEYIIVPACRMAGFWPERVDNPNTNNTALDILNIIIDSDIAICDLSSNNPNVLYGLAIRQALGLPVTLIKDLKTQIMFGIQEFEQVEYDESLRIDTVQKAIETLGEKLKKSHASKAEINSILNRLGIGPGRSAEIKNVSSDIVIAAIEEPIDQTENTVTKEKPLPVIFPLPNYVGDPITETEIEKIKVGDFLFHMNHGKGEIRTMKKMGKDKIAEILFESGSKTVVIGTSGFFRKINT